MPKGETIKDLYSEIRKCLFYMIPEKWDSIFLYASIFEGIQNLETGEMFFYYFPKGILRKEPVNVYEIPNKFNIEEDEYLNYLSLGYKVIWDENRIYFPIENGDASIIAENQRVAKIKFRRLSGEYKDGLIYICQEILSNEFNESQIRKTLKNIEKGE